MDRIGLEVNDMPAVIIPIKQVNDPVLHLLIDEVGIRQFRVTLKSSIYFVPFV